MVKSGYSAIKNHFDGIFNGNTRCGNGLEQIRDVYESAFGVVLSKYDIYTTNLRVSNNPISQIVTLVGPESDTIPTGIIPTIAVPNTVLACVNIINREYFKGINSSNITSYIYTVYLSMRNIMIGDSMFNVSDRIARSNPYCAFLKCYPMYAAYHHVCNVAKEEAFNYAAISTFKDIIEKDIYSSDDVDRLLESLCNNKYSTDFDDIYRTITCKGTLDILL